MGEGYINEGGQLKTKNGQKYIVNERREGIFVSKSCAILSAIIAVSAIIIAVLITYFLTSNFPEQRSNCPQLNGNAPATAGIYSNKNSYATNSKADLNDEAITNGNTITNGVSISNRNFIDDDDLDPNIMISDEGIKKPAKEIHLHKGWIPEMYTLVIQPNLEKSTTNGTVSIDIVRDLKVKGLYPILLDIKNITIIDIRVVRTDKDEAVEFEKGYGRDMETYYVKILNGIQDHERVTLSLHIEFISKITDTLQGIYKTSYTNALNGNKESMISTQFSPIDARRAFPCIDRPDKKANFSISIVHDQSKSMILSNTDMYFESEYAPGLIKKEFYTTPKMPTYLVAFIISNLSNMNLTTLTNDINLKPTVQIWARQEASKMTRFAYKLTRRVLPFFENYFEIPYALPKLDLVSIPDFGFGAMENWGLITFRDSSLLVPDDEERTSSASHTESVALTIAHELAHQWFGNLVTQKWWNDLWLKEGFATYLSYLAIDKLYPEWQIMETVPIYDFRAAMAEDSDLSSHEIRFPVTNHDDIRRIFDSITYSKGSLLVRMVNSIIGDEAFRLALHEFLTKFQYENADSDDLWDIMTKYGHELDTLHKDRNIKEIMDSWISQPGYPIINVTRMNESLIVEQRRYILPNGDKSDESKWFVPIQLATDDHNYESEFKTYWLTNTDDHIIIPDVFPTLNTSNKYVYLNIHRAGYYRVNYDYLSWIALKTRFLDLPSIVRATLLDDSLHLAKAEYLSYDIPLTFLMELPNLKEDELFWAAAEEGLTFLTYQMQREPAFELFRAFMKYLVREAFEFYGFNDPAAETHLQRNHRARIVRLSCRFNYDRCTNAAQLIYRKWMSKPKEFMISPNLKETVYCMALQEGSHAEWYFAYKQYNATTSSTEREQLLSAMGCTIKPWLLAKYLNMTLNPESGIRKQDGARAFSAVAKNSIGYEIAFDFLVTNIEKIRDYYGDGFATLNQMVDAITTYMNKDYQLEQLMRFGEKAKKLGLTSIEKTIHLAKEKVKNNIYWRSNCYHSLKTFLFSIVEYMHINLY
ncbi:aminopeptidase N isoform X2 [Condylostylus longicornis]|uniref:aminopeptidase N isoform X2 n=1 Tax=Condylostylus longicornis TaxID=2530218 RepID=UPI00244DE611|nr:aminopeptidase N isoform X2 [Condylostylus longicornis]